MVLIGRFWMLLVSLTAPLSALAQEWSPYAYDIGQPAVIDLYVDPSAGSDERNGLTAATAWRTVQKAWAQIPQSTTLTTGYRINLMNGQYGYDELPNYWELRRGTFEHPIILRPAPGQTAVRLVRDINMANVSYFYLLNVSIVPNGGGDTFHCEGCDHILLRGGTFDGGSTSGRAHETIKVNQSQYIYLENNRISDADDNAIDFVGVQYGHIVGNIVHDAQDWCAYVKGGSAYIRVESNEFYNCGVGGFTAGQGSGFQFMTTPWLHFEAYDIKVINNLVHDTYGAAFGVNGGYNVLIAHNTAYGIGRRSHMLEVVFGERTCDGQTNGAREDGCSSRNGVGGWGPKRVTLSPDPIGNRNVVIANNVLYNPPGVVAPQHFAIYGPRTARAGTNLASTQYTDTNLIIRGNVIWNGDSTTPLGIEDSSQGCQPSNQTCNEQQLRAENSINSAEPALRAPTSGDYRPGEGSALLSISGSAIPDFSGGDRPSSPASPAGQLSNSVTRDRSGAAGTTGRIPGAYAGFDSAITPPQIDESPAPPGGGENPTPAVPAVSKFAVSQKRKNGRVTLTFRADISGQPTSSSVVVRKGSRQLATASLTDQSATRYVGKTSLKIKAGTRLNLQLTATAATGQAQASKTVTAK